MLKSDFNRGWLHLASNGAITNSVLRNCDLHIQGQTILFAIHFLYKFRIQWKSRQICLDSHSAAVELFLFRVRWAVWRHRSWVSDHSGYWWISHLWRAILPSVDNVYIRSVFAVLEPGCLSRPFWVKNSSFEMETPKIDCKRQVHSLPLFEHLRQFEVVMR